VRGRRDRPAAEPGRRIGGRGGLGAFPLGPGRAQPDAAVPRRRLRTPPARGKRHRPMPPRRSGSWTLRDRDEHEGGARASELTGSRLTNRAVVPRGKVETSKERDLPSGAGVPGRARPGCLEGGWATGRAAVDGVRATARAAGSIRGRLGGDTIIFCVSSGPWPVRACRAAGYGRRGDTGVAARVCVLPPPRPMRGPGQADRPFLRSEACGPGILFRRSVAS